MNLSIGLIDFIDVHGRPKTYRFVPTNEYNKAGMRREGILRAAEKND